jgi:hypothetical protein
MHLRPSAARIRGEGDMENGRIQTRPAAALAICLLVTASLALTLGFACAVPLAAFAAISALTFDFGTAVVAILAVWLANQVVGFSILHYPTDPTTLSWGGALGALGLASLVFARLALDRTSGLIAAPAAFLASFVAYEGLLFVINVSVGAHEGVFASPVVARIFAINVAAFGVLYAMRALTSRAAVAARYAGSRARHA